MTWLLELTALVGFFGVVALIWILVIWAAKEVVSCVIDWSTDLRDWIRRRRQNKALNRIARIGDWSPYVFRT